MCIMFLICEKLKYFMLMTEVSESVTWYSVSGFFPLFDIQRWNAFTIRVIISSSNALSLHSQFHGRIHTKTIKASHKHKLKNLCLLLLIQSKSTVCACVCA